MPRYTVRDESSGKTVTFDWAGAEPPTDADMEEVFAEAGAASTPTEEPGALSRFFGGGNRPLSQETTDAARQMNATGPLGAAQEGAMQAAAQGITGPAINWISGLVKRGGKPLMRLAQGSQAGVRNRFPTVDTAEVALREGVGATNTAKATALGRGQAQELTRVASALDAGGAPRIMPREIIRGLRPVYDDAVAAERGGIAGEADKVMQVVRDIRRQMPREGLSVSEALTPKSKWQRLANPKYRAQAGQQVAVGPEIASGVAGSYTSAVRNRGMGPALTRAQELMALQQATRVAANRPSLLRNVMGMTVGSGVGAMTGEALPGIAAASVPMMMMSPRGLSAGAFALDRGGQPATDALLRLLVSHQVASQEPR